MLKRQFLSYQLIYCLFLRLNRTTGMRREDEGGGEEGGGEGERTFPVFGSEETMIQNVRWIEVKISPHVKLYLPKLLRYKIRCHYFISNKRIMESTEDYDISPDMVHINYRWKMFKKRHFPFFKKIIFLIIMLVIMAGIIYLIAACRLARTS